MVFRIVIIHFLGDFFNSFFKPLGPYFIDKFNIDSRTFGSTFAMISGIAAILQIFFGIFFDKRKKDGYYAFFLILLEMILIPLIGFIPSFILFLFLAFGIRILNSAFHPIGASIAGYTGEGKKIAYFSLAGAFGAGVGPIFITSYVKKVGIEHLWIVSLIGVIILFLFAKDILKVEKEKISERAFPGFMALKSLGIVFIVVMLRSFAMDVFHTYVPIYVKLKGGSLILGGTTLTIGMLVGTFTNYFGTYVREKTGIKIVNLISFLIMGISGLLFYYSNSDILRIITFALFDGAAFFNMSANIVEAQFLMPKNKAFASSISMGFSWAIGQFLSSGYASIFGNNVPFMLVSLSIIMLFSSVLVFFMKNVNYR